MNTKYLLEIEHHDSTERVIANKKNIIEVVDSSQLGYYSALNGTFFKEFGAISIEALSLYYSHETEKLLRKELKNNFSTLKKNAISDKLERLKEVVDALRNFDSNDYVDRPETFDHSGCHPDLICLDYLDYSFNTDYEIYFNEDDGFSKEPLIDSSCLQDFKSYLLYGGSGKYYSCDCICDLTNIKSYFIEEDSYSSTSLFITDKNEYFKVVNTNYDGAINYYGYLVEEEYASLEECLDDNEDLQNTDIKKE